MSAPKTPQVPALDGMAPLGFSAVKGEAHRVERSFTVSNPYHWEGRTVWYVMDSDGDPVDSYPSAADAESAAAAMDDSHLSPMDPAIRARIREGGQS